MLKNQSDTANILQERSKLNKRLAYEGLLVGIVSGAVCIVSVSYTHLTLPTTPYV